jgi:hypothetical protein
MIRRLNPVLETILIQRKSLINIKEALDDGGLSAEEKRKAKSRTIAPEEIPEEITQWAKIMLSLTPAIGDAIGIYDAVMDLTKGDTESAKLALLSAVPLLGVPADAKRYVIALEKLGVKNADSVVSSLRKGGTEAPPKPDTVPFTPPDWQTPKPKLPGERPIEVPRPGTPGYPRPVYPGPKPGVPGTPKPKPPEVEPPPSVPAKPPELEPTPLVPPSVPAKPPELEPVPTPTPLPLPKPYIPPKRPRVPKPREFDIPDEESEQEKEEKFDEKPFEEKEPGSSEKTKEFVFPDLFRLKRFFDKQKIETFEKTSVPETKEKLIKSITTTTKTTTDEEKRRDDSSDSKRISPESSNIKYEEQPSSSIPYDIDAILDRILGKYSTSLRIK